jgi:hypothetical protein
VPHASTTPPPTAAPVTAPPKPTTLADLSATVTSAQADASLNCSDDVRARVVLMNNGDVDVAVSGILMRTGTITGDCFGDHDFTYRSDHGIAPAKASTIVLDRSLFSGGPGCCDGKGCGGSCRFQNGFEVITSLGNVPAGAVDYKVFFQNCQSCAVTTSSGVGCARAWSGTRP